MSRNSETYFSQVPTVEMQRSTFDLSHEVQTTFNVGDLICLDCCEVYPGDTFEVSTTKVVRLQTLLNPIFGNLYLDVYHFFVPNRIVQDNWPAVMGENMTGAWAPQVEVVTPKIKSTNPIARGSIEDYYGLPVGTFDSIEFNALPIRGYHLIWSEFFRDENLQDPLNIYKGDATKSLRAINATDDLSELVQKPRKAARLHDYFSSCLPAPLKSNEPVNIPMSGRIPVIAGDIHDAQSGKLAFGSTGTVDGTFLGYSSGTTPSLTYAPNPGQTTYPSNLWADFSAVPGSDLITDYGITATINDLRLAFQIQKMLERDAFGGSRYRELILSHFSVSTGDARMQIPEYLGGSRFTLNISQVVNSSEDGSHPLGNLGALSHTVESHGDYIKSFVEHGFVHTLAVVRYENLYANGLERFWSRSDRYSYYWPSLAFIGNMAVLNKEIDFTGESTDDEVFGYQEAWADLRTRPNKATSLMRPGVSGSLASWNLADDYASQPILSAGWIESNKDVVDRTLAVTSAVSDQIFCDVWFDVKATRVLPMFSIPGLIDHF